MGSRGCSEEPVAISPDHSRRVLHGAIGMATCDLNGSVDDIESTLATLNARFPQANVNALKPVLESIEDLKRLKYLNLMASIVETFTDFCGHLEA